MTDIRRDLNHRLEQLRLTETEDRETLAKPTTHVMGHIRDLAERNVAERQHVEATLATFQLADAQNKATQAQKLATEEQARANRASEQARGKSEETLFWSRRFITSLAIGNGAAFVAVLSFMLKSDSPYVPFDDVYKALKAFGLGTLVAATFPVIRIVELWRGSNGRPRDEDGIIIDRPVRWWTKFYDLYGGSVPVVIFSLAFFALGMVVVLGCAQGYYQSKPHPAVSSQHGTNLDTKTSE